MGIVKDWNERRRALAKDTDGAIFTLVALGIIAGVSLLGTYYITKPVGEGIGEAFTLFGQSIALYMVIGLVIVAVIFLWLIFGKE